jgi:hypothetical protein
MAHEPLKHPHKRNYTAVRFTMANSDTLMLTDWTEDVTLSGISGTFSSEVSLGVKLPARAGVMKEGQLRINIPFDYQLAQDLTVGVPHQNVVVEVWSFSESTLVGTDSLLKEYAGTVIKAERNFDGHPERVQINAVNIKGRLNIALGIPCHHHCIWRFTGFGCQATPQVVVQKTPTAAARNKLTFSGMVGVHDRFEYLRGYIEFDGLKIGIRDYDDATGDIYLFREPPAAWATSLLNLNEGCDKQLVTCRDEKNNENNFGGFGYAMPSRHPMMDTH